MTAVIHDPAAQQFTTVVDGLTARLDYRLDDGVMTITHTRVPDAIGGRGIAAELTRAALEAARESRWSVVPACSYAAAYLSRHPQEAPAPTAQEHRDQLLDEALDETYPASDPPAVGGYD